MKKQYKAPALTADFISNQFAAALDGRGSQGEKLTAQQQAVRLKTIIELKKLELMASKQSATLGTTERVLISGGDK